MKTCRFITMILCLFVVLSLLTSCGGYNAIMRDHLSNRENYDSYCGKICDIYYYDEEYNKVSLLSSDEIPESSVMIKLTFEDYDTVRKLLGGMPNPDWSLDDFEFAFEITKENNQILMENGFYSAVALNTPINISSTSYIYMDGYFYFIAAVTYDDTEYLRFEDGFENIVEYINDNKSLL